MIYDKEKTLLCVLAEQASGAMRAIAPSVEALYGYLNAGGYDRLRRVETRETQERRHVIWEAVKRGGEA